MMNDIKTEEDINLGRFLKPLQARSLVENLLSSYGDFIKRERVEIIIEIEPSLPPVYANEDELTLIFSELIVNVFKYAFEDEDDEGYVKITATVTETAPDKIRFAVIDNGQGMDLAEQQSITKLFNQGSKRPESGQWLNLDIMQRLTMGLSICKSLVIDQYNQEIGFHSEDGLGSEFWFTMPTAKD